MSSRVTRSSARLAAETASTSTPDTLPPPPSSRKRKASAQRDSSPADASNSAKPASPRRSKRLKVAVPEKSPVIEARPRRQAAKQRESMANPGYGVPLNMVLFGQSLTITRSSSGPSGNIDDTPTAEQGGSRRRSGRNKKFNQGNIYSPVLCGFFN